MKRTYKIEFYKNVPIVETEGAKWMFDTGAAYSYLRGLDKDRFESAGIAEECDLSGSRWTAPMFRVPCELAGCQFEIVCGAASDNKYGVPPDGVIGYDFFKSFTVLINRREHRLSFKPVEE